MSGTLTCGDGTFEPGDAVLGPTWTRDTLDAMTTRGGVMSAQLKLEPQPHVRVAFGFVIENPAWVRPSL